MSAEACRRQTGADEWEELGDLPLARRLESVPKEKDAVRTAICPMWYDAENINNANPSPSVFRPGFLKEALAGDGRAFWRLSDRDGAFRQEWRTTAASGLQGAGKKLAKCQKVKYNKGKSKGSMGNSCRRAFSQAVNQAG